MPFFVFMYQSYFESFEQKKKKKKNHSKRKAWVKEDHFHTMDLFFVNALLFIFQNNMQEDLGLSFLFCYKIVLTEALRENFCIEE